MLLPSKTDVLASRRDALAGGCRGLARAQSECRRPTPAGAFIANPPERALGSWALSLLPKGRFIRSSAETPTRRTQTPWTLRKAASPAPAFRVHSQGAHLFS